jgi:hypothetical protein
MFKLFACILAVVLVGNTSDAGGARLTTSACVTDDSLAIFEIQNWATMMHSTDPADSAGITNAGLLYVPDTAFAVVSDSVMCATALAVHNADAGYTTTQLSDSAAAHIYAIRIGTRYVTWNPAFPSGEFIRHAVWDSTFHIIDHYY